MSEWRAVHIIKRYLNDALLALLALLAAHFGVRAKLCAEKTSAFGKVYFGWKPSTRVQSVGHDAVFKMFS